MLAWRNSRPQVCILERLPDGLALTDAAACSSGAPLGVESAVVVEPHSSRSLHVAWSPSAAGSFSGTLRLRMDDGPRHVRLELRVQGTAVEPPPAKAARAPTGAQLGGRPPVPLPPAPRHAAALPPPGAAKALPAARMLSLKKPVGPAPQVAAAPVRARGEEPQTPVAAVLQRAGLPGPFALGTVAAAPLTRLPPPTASARKPTGQAEPPGRAAPAVDLRRIRREGRGAGRPRNRDKGSFRRLWCTCRTVCRAARSASWQCPACRGGVALTKNGASAVHVCTHTHARTHMHKHH